jgi:hypothetical protein
MPISMFYDTSCANVASHTCNWVVPTGVTGVTFEIWGGGGGGASGNCECDCRVRTGAGGGGGYSTITIPVAPGATYAMTMGNGGVASNGYGGPTNSGAGAARGCCGGTTFITGTGLSNFCAEGGKGGCNDLATNCYSCACQADFGGLAYGGSINFKGGFAQMGRIGGNSCWSFFSNGGDAAGPGGGSGGKNMGSYSSFAYGDRCQNPLMDGMLPGGGGAGHGCGSECACCTVGSGRGAPGLIKITW